MIAFHEDALYRALGWCSCSDSAISAVFSAVMNDLLDHPTDRYYTAIAARLALDPRFVQLILLELTRLELIEHGTAIRGSWPIDYELDWPAKVAALCSPPKGEEEIEHA
jgi:hypothetical protein